MEEKYLKDFVIAMVVIILLVFAVKDYYLQKKIKEIPLESSYKNLALSQELLMQIQEIEESINDRKEFVFTVTKDPLEQNLIVRTKRDLEKLWQEEVAGMVRLEATMITETGRKIAAISYGGETKRYEIGDSFEFGKIIDIRQGELVYQHGNKTSVLALQQLPPKPAEIRSDTGTKSREYNW
ncbi:MAG: hypothetical protein JW784_02240 [Candidatus Cloacimonetes bacterium]|nr:hypothetical protein [Candidatus Cloacimonadota bacterium]